MKKHRPTTIHPTWDHKGQRIDIRELSDTKAAALLKDGFKQIEKIPTGN